MKRESISGVMIATGIVILAVAGFMVIQSLYKAELADKSVEAVQAQLEKVLNEKDKDESSGDQQISEASITIDGKTYIGMLAIPKLELDLPIMDAWSYPNLNIAPCRYSGSIKTDDLVIAAHNYTQHFGTLKTLLTGDKVYLTDVNGVLHAYEVVEIETVAPTDISHIIDSEYDLTLFTCTVGGKSRVTVRCNQLEQGSQLKNEDDINKTVIKQKK